MKLHLGCGKTILPNWVNIDCFPAEGVTVFDLARCRENKLPFPDDSVDEIFASHLIEHIPDTLSMMQELHRVAQPGCKAVFRLPYGTSSDAWEDPTHVRPYFLNSFLYFSQPAFWRADYGYKGDWRTDRTVLLIEKAVMDHYGQRNIGEAVTRFNNVVRELVVELSAVKPIRQPLQKLQTPLNVVIEIVAP